MARRRRRRRRKRSVRLKIKRDSILSVGAVLLLLLSVLSFISFFAQAASFNILIQEILNNLFGWTAFLIPFIIGLAGLVLLRTFYWRFVNLRVLTGLVLATGCLSGLSHLLLGAERGKEEALLGQGGGVVGFAISAFLREHLSTAGAFFVLLAGLAISVLVISNASVRQLFGELQGLPELWERLREGWRGSAGPPAGGEEEEAEGDTPATPTEAEAEAKVQEELREGVIEVVASLAEPTNWQATAVPDSKGRRRTSATPGLRQTTVVNRPEDQIWEYPPLSILADAPEREADRGDISKNASIIEETLASFGVKAKVVEINEGPSVTQYALGSAQGTKIAKISNLQNDIAMALASPTGSVRIEAPIPGKSLVGVEVPNIRPSLVGLRSVVTTSEMKDSSAKLLVSIGHDVAGKSVIGDLALMPHVLIAGATGSGKSTLIHAFLASLLFRCSPSELKLILVDTKRVELTEYNSIPHLLTPVVVNPEKVISALRWAISEMERRYKLFQTAGVRNLEGYNDLSGFQALPYIVIMIDELADMMALAPVDTEKAVCRLAQLARATGIHLILSTQRPSVDVITGLIKANIPCRVAFNVTSQVDSRVIIDQSGAEKLLGRGDGLYVPPDASKPIRIQGVFVSPPEIQKLIGFLKASNVEPEYKEEVVAFEGGVFGRKPAQGESEDELFEDAVAIVHAAGRGSASLLQRKLKIGYARAARLLDDLEVAGIVGPQEGSKPREVLAQSGGLSAFGREGTVGSFGTAGETTGGDHGEEFPSDEDRLLHS